MPAITRGTGETANTLLSLQRPSFKTKSNHKKNQMNALYRAATVGAHTSRPLNNTDIPLFLNNKLINKLNKLSNMGMKRRVEALHQLWFGLDTYHDLVDGDRARNLVQFVSKTTNSKFNIDDLSTFLLNDKLKLRKLIEENLKSNENALKIKDALIPQGTP